MCDLLAVCPAFQVNDGTPEVRALQDRAVRNGHGVRPVYPHHAQQHG